MNQIFNITMIIFTNQIAVEEPLFVCLSFFKSGNWVYSEAESENIRKGNKNFEGCFYKQRHIN